MRLRKRAWVKDEIMNYENYSIKSPEKNQGNWQKVFINNNPIHVEFGTGRGQFIVTHAKNNPDINYIAIEQKQEVLVQAIRKANQLELNNIKFILGNVGLISNFFAQKEITRIYLNFVDPWPKKRHAKRRLTHRNFLKMYKQILADDGNICLKTDNEELFEFSLNELTNNNFHLKSISLNLYRAQENLTKHVQTEYEEKFIGQGKQIYWLEAESALSN